MGISTLFSTKRTKSIHYADEDIERRNARDSRIHPQHRLLTPFLLDKRVPPIPTEEERIEFPFRKTNLFSESFYLWCLPLLSVGYRRTIQPEDLYKIPRGSTYDVESRTKIFLGHFYAMKERAETHHMERYHIEDTPENREQLQFSPDFKYPRYLVLLALYKTYFFNFTFATLCKALADVASALNTLQIKALINYVHKKALHEEVGKSGYGLAVGVACVVFVIGLLYARNFNDASFCGAEIKGVLTKVLLDKSFRLSKDSRTKFPSSTVTAYLGNDLSKIDLATNFFSFIVCLPIGLGITIALLAVNLGGASLSGIAWFILITGFIMYSTRYLMRWRKSVNVQTDARVKHTKEVLINIKMIKYYAWEIPFTKLISKLRSQEMKIMLKVQFFRNMITGIAVTLPMCSALIGFLSMYGQLGGLKNASNIFSSVTLFNILTMHVAMLPTALTSASDAWIAFTRVQEFLLAEESKPDVNYHKTEYNPQKPAINIKNAAFDWLKPSDDTCSVGSGLTESVTSEKHSLTDELTEKQTLNLHGIDIQIKHGEFIVITGTIGSGKSSLLAAINGTMTRVTGAVDISGDLVLCANPWIQNTTVRENITFGLDYDRETYQTVIESCALPSDFEILPAGDMTEIGERGVNLSGGQKARISLARTVYRAYTLKEYNIVMFDDVLSAVDAKVGKHIMQECILGLLRDKTRILATHQLSLIGEADRIVYMNGDGTTDIGTHEELVERNDRFRALMDFQMEGEVKAEEDEDDEDLDVKESELKLIRKQTTKDERQGRMIQVEHIKSNAISKTMFAAYLRSGCGKLGPRIVLSNLLCAIILTSFCMLFENVWLSFWSLRKFKAYGDPFYIGIYVMVTCFFVLCAIWQFCTIAFISNRASKLLNLSCLRNIMYAPMSFFDTTPLGRIMNRFTKDTDVLDNEIAEQARLTCLGFGNVIGVLILCIIYLPWFAITIPVLFLFVIVIFSYYQATSREIKRIEGAARSFVFSNFDEALQGMSTIKLFSASRRFMDRNSKNINVMNESYFAAVCLMRWFSIPLHGAAGSISLVITMLCVSNAYPISAAGSGLLISFAVQFSMQIISSTRALGQLEQLLSSVERICEYATELPSEASYNTPESIELPKSWPQSGAIKFNKVSLKYREELPLVLKNMTLDIKAGEKIGICGRTGAGKSTIMTALYRLSEPEGGNIEIDGVDIQSIGLFDLRSRLAIIPQDPVLFRGDIRRNLDPFGELSDSVLKSALDIASGYASSDHDKDSEIDIIQASDSNTDNEKKFSLDTFVEDDGANFSLGERQVIALCRALIRNTKILILDEATSSVDYETDARIQETISNGFRDCTILCIAHRLRTILNYDRILVMDKGECAEFDTPKKLWMAEGIFRSMCDKSGIDENDFQPS
ncbi:hypothetical protein PICMEDRAFT_15376 [Pichia membranifaciens NRRL Y-2026]|uniref:Oligomycin resistance ATP-dependent permease YOR1 n=1 Tax=Pichia membranifaciens NRRL Y-2026 TaxID=763406 RepID=A0A1E3NMR2_9ASCO|nr:hypothetical protein PICMEDRAFT_15376 [Pichia membranifaciens NRRL Y-2026]ODQ47425.1 hypothetical protein PICMEDRAFT_15376 [Pichia membranifaciens NRRL Y-2026]